jgi:hypothetical protein
MRTLCQHHLSCLFQTRKFGAISKCMNHGTDHFEEKAHKDIWIYLRQWLTHSTIHFKETNIYTQKKVFHGVKKEKELRVWNCVNHLVSGVDLDVVLLLLFLSLRFDDRDASDLKFINSEDIFLIHSYFSVHKLLRTKKKFVVRFLGFVASCMGFLFWSSFIG